MVDSARDGRPVVVGVDESDSARYAAEWAADLAAVWGAPLRVVHTVPGCVDEPPIAVAPVWLRELVDAAVRSGVEDTDFEVVPGGTGDLLPDRSRGARLIIVGSYGDGRWSGMLAGSTALALIARASCPVAVVRGRAPQVAPPRGGAVVVGVDGTAVGDAALDPAADLAASLGARLLAVHTWSDVVADGSGAAHRLHDDWSVLADRGARLLDEHLAPVQARHPELHIERDLVAGSPLRVLLERARDARAVVVGRRGEASSHGMLLGSTSRGLAEFAPCPVVVTQSPANRAPGPIEPPVEASR